MPEARLARDRIEALLRKMAATKVVVVGDAMLDVYVVGEDQRGQSVRAELDDLRLNSSFLITDSARPTTSKTRVVARGQQMLRIDEEIDDPISAKVMEKLARALEHALEDADTLLIEDYNKGTLVPQVIERAMTIAKRR